MKTPSPSRLLLPLAASIAALIPSAFAGTIWDGGGADDLWGSGLNWNDDSAPVPGVTVDLTFDGVTRLTPVNNYGAFDDFHSITFAATAGTFSLTGSAIDLFGKIENYSALAQTVAMDLAIQAGQPGTGEFNPVSGDLFINSANVFTNGNTLHVYGVAGKTVTFGSGTVISGTGAFNVEQASNVVFLGANTYTGSTNVLAGSLTVGNGGTTGALGTGVVTVAVGATLGYNRSNDFTVGNTLNVGGTLVKSGAGIMTIATAQTGITGSVLVNAGRILLGVDNALGTAAITLNGGSIERNSTTAIIPNPISIGASGGTIVGRTPTDAYATFSGQFTGSGALTFQGLSVLNNATNTYGGPITISNAAPSYLRLSASEVLGDTTSVNLAGPNSNLRLDGGVTETISGLSGAGILFVSKTGSVLNGNLRVGAGNSSSTYSGTINNNDGIFTLTKIGNGTLTLGLLGGTFSSLVVSQGAVSSTNGNLGNAATVTLGDAGTGASNVSFTTTGSAVSRPIVVTANGTGTATVGSTGGAGNANFSGQITLNRPTTITAGSTDRTTFTGKITGTVGTLTFTGGRRTVLESGLGVNDFVGDVVITGAGTVLQTGAGNLNGEVIPNASSVNVGAGAFFKLANVGGSTETINALDGSGTVQRHEGVDGLATLAFGSAGGSGSFSGPILNGTAARILALRKEGAGTQTINVVGGNTASGGVTVNGGVLRFVGTAGFDSGALSATQTYTVNGPGTLEFNGDWLTKGANTYNVNGGTLAFTKTTGDVTLSYVNNLNLTDGTIIGPGNYRVGNNTAATHNFSGNLGNTIASRVGLVKNGAAQTVTLNVADGTADADLTVSGAIYDVLNFAGATLIKSGPGKLVTTAANTYVGPTSVSNGTLQIGDGGTTGALSAGAVDVTGTLAFKRSDSVIFANSITGTGGLKQSGTGSTLLAGATVSYTGPTVVEAGTLITTPAQTGATSITVADGATFGVSMLSPGTTHLSTSIATGTVTGASLLFDTAAFGNLTVPLIETSTFTPTAATALRVSGTALTAGTFPLIKYTTLDGLGFAGLTLTLPYRIGGALVNNIANTTIDVSISGAETAKWQGNVAGGDWDIDPDGSNTAGTINWKTSLLGTPTRYAQGPINTDTVTFDDTATGTGTVNLTSTLTPLGILVDNSTAKTYTFAGAGKLSGLTSLVKNSDGTLIIANTTANDYSGGTTISGGTVQLGDGVTAGAGVIAGNVTNNGALAFNHPENFTFSNAITGGGIVTQQSNGILTLSGANSYSGGSTVVRGTLRGLTNNAFGIGPITLGDGSANNVALYLGNRADVGNAITVEGLGTGTVTIGADNTGSGANAATFFGTMTLNRSTTFSGEVFADRLALDGQITGTPGSITITGGSRVTFASTSNDFVGDIFVNGAGTIFQPSVATAAEVIPNTSSVFVDAGAVLQLASISGTETIDALNGSGTVRTFIAGNFGSGLAVGFGNSDGVFSGTMLDGGGNNPLSLIKLGTGTQTITGLNSYTGGTTISGGVLVVNADTALGASASGIAINNNAKLKVTGPLSTFARTLTLGSGGGTIDTNGNDVLFGGGSTITGAETLTKVGAGKLTLGGLQTYSALTAEGGLTELTSALGTGTSTITANADVNIIESQTLAALNIGDGAVVTLGGFIPPAPALAELNAAPVPEPGITALLLGSLTLLASKRRRAQK